MRNKKSAKRSQQSKLEFPKANSTKRANKSTTVAKPDDGNHAQTSRGSSRLQNPFNSKAEQRKKRARITISSSEETDDANGKDVKDELLEVGEAESSSDEIIFSSQVNKPAARRGSAAKPKDEFINDSSDTSSDESAVSTSIRRRRSQNASKSRKKTVIELSDSPESEDELQVRKRTVRRDTAAENQNQTPKKRKREDVLLEEEELAEDLKFLRSSSPLTEPPSSASKINARQQALQELRIRRGGTQAIKTSHRRVIQSDSSDDDESIGRNTQSDKQPDSDDEVDLGESEDEQDATAMFEEDEDDEGFVVEDDENDQIGVPVDMPLQFSSLSRAKTRDLFKFIVEWMVQKKLNPAFAISDELYDLSFKKLNDEVQGLAGSKFISSVWTSNFTTALKARPAIVLLENDASFENHCEACNRNHKVSWDIQFQGKPYDLDSLEEIEPFDDLDGESNETDEVNEFYDSAGRLIPPESKVFHVGRHCKANAQTAHALQHWKYNLYEWVVQYLKDEGELSPEKIVARDPWTTRKRQKYANDVVDTMVANGTVQRLYRDFRGEINSAREAKSKLTTWG